jgi:2,3-bisphosphoglycerate-dependent phosphoglycerate mutase
MDTSIYLIRHGQSPKKEGSERNRGLTEQGLADARRIAEHLSNEGIDAFYSSPYQRASLTLEPLAQACGTYITAVEDLKETVFVGGDAIMQDDTLIPTVSRMFREPDFALPGGESLTAAKDRVMAAFNTILEAHPGQKIAIGTHGMVMTLILGHFDSRYDFDFLMKTSKPDVYRMTFRENRFLESARLWLS